MLNESRDILTTGSSTRPNIWFLLLAVLLAGLPIFLVSVWADFLYVGSIISITLSFIYRLPNKKQEDDPLF